jgi:hypothetical protein
MRLSYVIYKAQSGFVLVSVLWVLVIMIMAASAFAMWVSVVREEAWTRQQRMDSYRSSTESLNKIVYSYLTGIKTTQGIPWPKLGVSSEVANEVYFENFDAFLGGAAPKVKNLSEAGYIKFNEDVLDLGANVRVMVQDKNGLIGLSKLYATEVFDNLIKLTNDTKTNPQRLRDLLADYQDRNPIPALQGAEAREYRQRKLTEPLNGYLRYPLQIRSVMDWNDLLSKKSDAWILRTFKASGNSTVNVNTAPAAVLPLVLKDSANAQAIVELRNQKNIESVFDLTKYAGGTEDIPFSLMPSGGFRFWWWYEGSATAQVYDVQFEYQAPGQKAWYINWTTRVTLPDDLSKSTAIKINHPFFH